MKREAADNGDITKPAGQVSHLLHDELHVRGHVGVSAPYGDFVLDRAKRTPVILVRGGVGLTPMISMLATIVTDSTTRASVSSTLIATVVCTRLANGSTT